MERYRIAELAQETGVTPRTIRYYVAEGLLPPPEGAGPAAVYGAGHRARLELIGRLKDQYLPLKEIRRRLATLTDDEVRAWLARGAGEAEQGTAAAPAAPAAQTQGGTMEMLAAAAPPSDSAADYLDRVLGRAAESRPPHYQFPPPVPPIPLPSIPIPGTPRTPRTPIVPAQREHWERIVLADGVELHVREDRRAGVIPLDALIRAARKLLGEE
jgi:DNA-binding transcriptional MerR regulator